MNEHVNRMDTALAFDHGPRDAVQDDQSLFAVLNVLCRDDEDRSAQFGYRNLIFRFKLTDLLFTQPS